MRVEDDAEVEYGRPREKLDRSADSEDMKDTDGIREESCSRRPDRRDGSRDDAGGGGVGVASPPSAGGGLAAGLNSVAIPRYLLLHKTRLCRDFMQTGKCQFVGLCSFAHGRHELRSAQVRASKEPFKVAL